MHIDFLNVLNSSSLLFLKLALQLPAPLQPVQLPPKLGSEQEGECCVSPVVVLPRHEPGQLLALVWVAAAAPVEGWQRSQPAPTWGAWANSQQKPAMVRPSSVLGFFGNR